MKLGADARTGPAASRKSIDESFVGDMSDIDTCIGPPFVPFDESFLVGNISWVVNDGMSEPDKEPYTDGISLVGGCLGGLLPIL